MAIPMATITSQLSSTPTMFDLRYSNWNQDFFMGLKPNAQYGSSAALNLAPATSSFISFSNSLTNAPVSTDNSGFLTTSSSSSWNIGSNDVSALRKALGLSTSSTSSDVTSVFSIRSSSSRSYATLERGNSI